MPNLELIEIKRITVCNIIIIIIIIIFVFVWFLKNTHIQMRADTMMEDDQSMSRDVIICNRFEFTNMEEYAWSDHTMTDCTPALF